MSKITVFVVIVTVLSVWTDASKLRSSSLDVEDPYGSMMGKMPGGMMGKMPGGMMGKMPGGGMGGMMPGGGMGGMMPGGGMGGMMPGGGMGGMMPGGGMGGMMPGGGSMKPGGGSTKPSGGGSTTPSGGNTNSGSNAVVAWHGKGVDVSAPCGNWPCLKQAGYSFAVVRIFQETGKVDPNGVASVKAAWAAGFTAVDVYMYPAGTSSSTGVAQATAVLNALKGVKYGRIWIDIEGVGTSWTKTASSNVKLFTDITSTLTKGGASVGVYTQGWQWNSIMGSSTAGSSFPVWYAEYGQGPGTYNTNDGTCQYSGAPQSLSSFSPFGGWTKAYAKQYNGDCTKCGCSIDVNYAP